MNFQPASNSAMYIGEDQRFDRDVNARTRFQKDEKAKRLMTEAMRVEAIRSHSNFYQQKNLQSEMLKTMRDQSNLKTRLDSLTAYEQVNSDYFTQIFLTLLFSSSNAIFETNSSNKIFAFAFLFCQSKAINYYFQTFVFSVSSIFL